MNIYSSTGNNDLYDHCLS